MSLPSLAAPLRASSVTMATSSTTPPHAPFSSPMVSSYGCHVPIILLRTGKRNVRFVPRITSFAVSFSKRLFLLSTGSKPSMSPHTFSIAYPPKLLRPALPTLLSLAPHQITHICESLAAPATRTARPRCPISCLLALLAVFSWGIPPITKVTGVSTLPPTKFTYPIMCFLMRHPFPLPDALLQLTLMTYVFLMSLRRGFAPLALLCFPLQVRLSPAPCAALALFGSSRRTLP